MQNSMLAKCFVSSKREASMKTNLRNMPHSTEKSSLQKNSDIAQFFSNFCILLSETQYTSDIPSKLGMLRNNFEPPLHHETYFEPNVKCLDIASCATENLI